MKNVELSIDNPMLKMAKDGFNACLKAMVVKAISTGSMEGTASLKISFEIMDVIEDKTGEVGKRPEIKFKAGYSVPIKNGCDGTIHEESRIIPNPEGGYNLISGQISMDELLG